MKNRSPNSSRMLRKYSWRSFIYISVILCLQRKGFPLRNTIGHGMYNVGRYRSRRILLPLVPLCGDNIMSKKGLGLTGAPSP